MQHVAVERHNAAGRDDQRIAGIAAGVADQVVGAFFLEVVNDFVRACRAREWGRI